MYVIGRNVPADNASFKDPFLYFSFLVVGLAASIAVVTALCIFGKKSSPPSNLPDSSEKTTALNASNPPTTMDPTATSPEHIKETEDNDMLTKELPLPPAMQRPKEPYSSINMKRANSERKMSLNMSLKMPRSLSMVKNRDQKEDKDERKKWKLKSDDSVWMKTIILGEKCVPDEEEDAIIYEGKGKKISAYHPKNSSMSLSRQWSLIDPDAISVSKTQEERIKNV